MEISFRALACLATVFAGLVAGCGGPASGQAAPSRQQRIEQAVDAAARFLLARQSGDGAWRSDTYGVLKDGPSLTPLVVRALVAMPASKERDAAARKGVAYLASLVRSDGGIEPGPYGLSYPVYTSALATQMLSGPAGVDHRAARDAWLAYLRGRQLTEELGWQPEDRPYGGWGYSPGLPRKPAPGQPVPPLTESNLSATVFALDALRVAGVRADDPCFARARTFVERCQNYGGGSRWDDGGFFFIYDDAVRNKAGVAGTDADGRPRFASYGSTTADGLRALLDCGLGLDDTRVKAAWRWLEKNFRADAHPGGYAPNREGARPAVYFYYCASVSQTLNVLRAANMAFPPVAARWREALADAVLERQQDDGSWINAAVAVHEDDPITATCLAVVALTSCR
jgi:squalene-hopene/tetraprenyl-beta-curcumene cyclase